MVGLAAQCDLFFMRRDPNRAVVTPHSEIGGFDFSLLYLHWWLPVWFSASAETCPSQRTFGQNEAGLGGFAAPDNNRAQLGAAHS